MAFNDDPTRLPAGRNAALDYLRVAGLMLMSLTHMLRMVWGSSGLDGVVQTIAETGQFPFFVAFGMTQSRLFHSRAKAVLPFLILFGALGTVHSLFMWYTLTWEFLLFLWFAALVIVLAATWGLTEYHLLVLSGVVLFANGLQPLTALSSQSAFSSLRGPFSPLPWIVVVCAGLGLGLDYPTWFAKPGPLLGVVGVTAAAWAYLVEGAPPNIPVAVHIGLQKWSATSTYLVAGCAETMLLYLVLGRLQAFTAMRRYVYPTVRFISDHLLVATVWHYLVVRILMDGRFHWHLVSKGVRTATWMEVTFLSVANLLLLAGSLKLLIMGWDAVTRRCDRLLRQVPYGAVAVGALAVVTVLRAEIGRLGLFSFRWLAFSIMLIVALFLEFDRHRRRPARATRAGTTT